jgi:hypothetical protein
MVPNPIFKNRTAFRVLLDFEIKRLDKLIKLN